MNKVTLLGNVGADPDVRSTPSGVRVATLAVATSRQWNDRQGNKQEKTEWHRVLLWDKLAEIAEKYVGKGDRLYVEGEIEYRTYEKDGETKYTTEIRAREIVMLGGKDGPKAGSAAGAKPQPGYGDFEQDFPENDDLPF